MKHYLYLFLCMVGYNVMEGEIMENDMIVKKVYVGECAGSHSVDSPRKRWIDTVKECLRKTGLDVKQLRRMCRVGVNRGGL